MCDTSQILIDGHIDMSRIALHYGSVLRNKEVW